MEDLKQTPQDATEEFKARLRAEIQHEAERLALMRELEEKGELHSAELSNTKGLELGAFLWFKDTEGKDVMVQVLDIDFETNTVKVRELPTAEAKKVQGVNRKARRAPKPAPKKARKRRAP